MVAELDVRRKLLSLVLIPSVLMSGLLGYFGFRDYQLLREGLLEHGISQAIHLAEIAEFGLATGNLSQLEAAAESTRARGAVAVRIYDAEGNVAITSGNAVDIKTPASTTDAAACGETHNLFFFCAPVRMLPLSVDQFSEFGGDAIPVAPIGHVELVLSAKELGIRRAAVIQRYAAVLVSVMAMGFLLARRVERQLARPIGGLRDAVERIGAGDLSVRIRENARGELLTLQRGFNAMAQSLASNHAELERRITEATAQLRKTLQELEQRNSQLGIETQRAEAASVAKSRFLAVMSHEIRTPLAGMIGMLSLLEASGLKEEQAAYVRHVESAAETLRLLIDEILDYSRIEAGKLAVFNDPIHLTVVIDDVVNMLAPSAASKGLRFIVQVEPEVPDGIIGDALRLRQVLINLTANAIKFTEQGKVSIGVCRVDGTGDEPPRLRFTVEDTGIGIPAAQRDQVFESFAQVDSGPTRRYSGSGLGAAVSRELVHLMGGEIGFRSAPGVGSQFWFELPLALDPSAVAQQAPLAGKRVAVIDGDVEARDAMTVLLRRLGAQVVNFSQDPEPASMAEGSVLDFLFLGEGGAADMLHAYAGTCRAHGQVRHVCHVTPITGVSAPGVYDCILSKPVTRSRLLAGITEAVARGEQAKPSGNGPQGALRVLVAEDDDINARVIESLLKKMGHTVARARDGREALQRLALETFDIAVLDVRMPEVDGTAVARQWRAREQQTGGYLPMVALTANGSHEDMDLCGEAGMDEFLVKPISEQTLARVLADLTSPGRKQVALQEEKNNQA